MTPLLLFDSVALLRRTTSKRLNKSKQPSLRTQNDFTVHPIHLTGYWMIQRNLYRTKKPRAQPLAPLGFIC